MCSIHKRKKKNNFLSPHFHVPLSRPFRSHVVGQTVSTTPCKGWLQGATHTVERRCEGPTPDTQLVSRSRRECHRRGLIQRSHTKHTQADSSLRCYVAKARQHDRVSGEHRVKDTSVRTRDYGNTRRGLLDKKKKKIEKVTFITHTVCAHVKHLEETLSLFANLPLSKATFRASQVINEWS